MQQTEQAVQGDMPPTAMIERFYYGGTDTPAPNVPLHPGVSAVLFDSSRRILILKRPRGGWWCLPGGRMEQGESAPKCCIRETWEETGLQTEIARLISVNTNPQSVVQYPDGNVHQSFVLCFEARVIGGALKQSAESDAFHWMSREEVDSIRLIPDSRINVMDAWAEQTAAFIR